MEKPDFSKNEAAIWDNHVIESGRQSFMFNANEEHPLFNISIESAGPSRESVDFFPVKLDRSELDSDDFMLRAKTIGRRVIMAGNMRVTSGMPIPDVSVEERKAEWRKSAQENVANYFEAMNIPSEKVVFLSPQDDYRDSHALLRMVNVEETPSKLYPKIGSYLEEKADFIYSTDMTKIFAVKPGDCPIIYARGQTNKGPIQCMIHIPWPGADSKGSQHGGYIEQMFGHFKDLGIDVSSLRLNISGGARATSFSYSFKTNPLENNPGKDLLFRNVTKNANNDGFECSIDTPVFIRDQLLKNGLNEYQICQDATDTASQLCGHGSNSRGHKNGVSKEINARDIVVASPIDYPNHSI